VAPRDYARSHPFISFNVDLKHCAPDFWMQLGEARSKCDHIKYVPLSGETARQLSLVYFAKGINATTAIEGNTLSEAEVLDRMTGQLDLPISKEYLGTEVDNMVGAYNEIISQIHDGKTIPVSIDTLRHLNKRILDGLEAEPYVQPGELRSLDVRAGPYLAAPWSDVPYLLDRLCAWLESDQFKAPSDDLRIPYAFIRAVVAHIYIEWIHPFGDGNGRLGRLVEFLILISSGVPLPAAHVLTSHYNDTRTAYYRHLNEASRNGGDLRAFLRYASQGFVDGLTAAIKHLHKQQEQLMWQSLVDDALDGKHTPAAGRQRLLALELGKSSGGFPRSEIRRITPALAEHYAGRTGKTLTRDLNRLIELELIDIHHGVVRARLARVRGMRPMVASEGDEVEA
jgi:Fic family protein